jgi:hypothetical protein
MRMAMGVALLFASACASEPGASGAGGGCKIEGTYTLEATLETQSAGCEDLFDPATNPNAGAQQVVTITAKPPGLRGPDFAIEIQGASGACAGDIVDACTVQTKCDLNVTDALDPNNATGTLQFSWTFSATGFEGLNSGALPPAKTAPKGCTFTSRAVGVRR